MISMSRLEHSWMEPHHSISMDNILTLCLPASSLSAAP